jgi:hypothetical protein
MQIVKVALVDLGYHPYHSFNLLKKKELIIIKNVNDHQTPYMP